MRTVFLDIEVAGRGAGRPRRVFKLDCHAVTGLVSTVGESRSVFFYDDGPDKHCDDPQVNSPPPTHRFVDSACPPHGRERGRSRPRSRSLTATTLRSATSGDL